MEREEIRKEILELLTELHEDVDFEEEEALVDDKVLDSFDLVTLVTELGETFDVEVTAREYDCNPIEQTDFIFREYDYSIAEFVVGCIVHV